jgi:hypothetical protein
VQRGSASPAKKKEFIGRCLSPSAGNLFAAFALVFIGVLVTRIHIQDLVIIGAVFTVATLTWF